MRGICPVLANHAGERGAVAPPVGFAHLIGGGALQLQVLGDIVGHLLVDQRKHPGAGVVQGVIQVKDHKREDGMARRDKSNQAG